MEGVASEVSLKIRSAIKAKLVELGTYVDEELPDYIMVLVANKKTKDQMDDDLSLFLGHNTERFTSWLHHVLQKLNAAALLQGTGPSTEPGRSKVTPQEEAKRKELEDEKRKEKEKEEEKRKEREEEKKRLKAEETKKLKEEEKRKGKEKEKIERKRKSSERKSGEKKDKKLKKSESPTSPEKITKDKRLVSEVIKPIKVKEVPKEKEKAKPPPPKEELLCSFEKSTPAAAEVAPVQSSLDVSLKKIKPLVRGKISSADIFRAESQAEQKKEEEEEELEEDLLVLRADVDELGLELEDEPTPRKSKQEQIHRAVQLRADGKQESKVEVKVASKAEAKEKADHRDKIELREKIDYKEKTKPKSELAPPRISAKERLGGLVAPRPGASRDKPSVLDRLGSSTSGKHMINLREESGGPVRSESSGAHSQGVARVVSSAITSAHRSVCVLPSSNSSGKKLEARVRPLMSRQIESSHVGVSRGVSEEATASSDEHVRESVSRPSGRVVSAVGAVLKRTHSQADSDDEEYDPKKPGLSGVASKVEVTPRPRRPRAIQANTALILRAMADAHKSVNRPSHHTREREKVEKQKPRKKHKGELFSRSYRQREEAARQKGSSDSHMETQEAVTIRKIAITVPNATHKEGEKQAKQEKKKEEDEEETMEEDEEEEEEEVKVAVSVAMRPHVPEAQIEASPKNSKEVAMDTHEEEKAQVSDNDYGMEEVEEVEEEVVDEGIEEDQPPIQHSLPPAIVSSGENTKFIVTLEGVDNEVFPEKEEPLSIRSRLGVRPPPADTEEQVEEYIEEVEEWEEEEEVPEELSVTSGVPVGGHVTGVKARLKAAATPALPLQPGGSKERCKYWPLCKAGEACIYHHPTVTCKSFPACKFGDKCLFIHPNCLYDGACTRIGCPYTHASSRNFAMVSAAAQKHKAVPPTRTTKVKCKFFPKCTNLSCPFLHPKACYYGAACKQANCPFTHPAVPMGAKLKWVAPKVSTSQTSTATTTTTTTAADSKEIGKTEENLINK